MAKRFSRAAAIPLVVTGALLLSSCSLFSQPTATVSDVIGTWKSDRFDAALVFRDDMTFDARNVPAGYIYINPPDGGAQDEPFTFPGTWELVPPYNSSDSFSVLLNFDILEPGSYKYLNMRFTGDHLDQLYLWKGDPDGGDFLSFFPESRDG